MSGKPATYTFQGTEYEIAFTVGKAIEFKAEFKINLLNLFEGANLEDFANTVTLNDEKMLDVWWYFVSTKRASREEAINLLTQDSLSEFKEAFWAAVVNFSDPNAKGLLLEVKKQLPELLKELGKSLSKSMMEQVQQSQNSETTS